MTGNRAFVLVAVVILAVGVPVSLWLHVIVLRVLL